MQYEGRNLSNGVKSNAKLNLYGVTQPNILHGSSLVIQSYFEAKGCLCFKVFRLPASISPFLNVSCFSLNSGNVSFVVY